MTERTRRTIVVATFTLAIVTGFAAVGSEPGPQATEQPVDQVVAAAVPATIPAGARAMKNPFPATEETRERGARLYAAQCAMCHGSRGAGDGELAGSLRMKMPDFRAPSARTEGELFFIITNGHGRMPADGERFEPAWRWDMVRHVRSLRTSD